MVDDDPDEYAGLRAWVSDKLDVIERLMGEGDAGWRKAAQTAEGVDAVILEMERLEGRPSDLRAVGDRFAVLRQLLGRS